MSVDREKLLLLANSVIPDLHDEFYKGQCGRIGFIGGCMLYTGAPYFASISSLKLGSDLVFVFCTASAAIPIKSYSPELIVIPILDSNDVETSLPRYLQGLHALVIGPGLGKDDSLTKAIMIAVKTMRDSNKPILLDADSLYFVGKDFDLIRDYSKAILTPNAIEFSRVYKILFGRDLSKEEMQSPRRQLEEVCKEIGSVTVVVKGKNDHISDGHSLLICDDEGSSRRCGGQGDLLVGSLANFAFWSNLAKNKSDSHISREGINPFMIAAFAACTLTRKCNRLAFERFGRCMTTSDMIKELPNAFANLFPFKLKS